MCSKFSIKPYLKFINKRVLVLLKNIISFLFSLICHSGCLCTPLIEVQYTLYWLQREPVSPEGSDAKVLGSEEKTSCKIKFKHQYPGREGLLLASAFRSFNI